MGETNAIGEVGKKTIDKVNNQENITFTNVLLEGITSLQDTLSLIIEGSKDANEDEVSAFTYANDALISFADGPYILTTIKPRLKRESDRQKILAGQHVGLYIQFNSEDNTTLKLNFWGGLRATSANDYRDRDLTRRNTHVQRTLQIMTQNTHLNWQIKFPNGPNIESWIVYRPVNTGNFIQSSLKIDDEKIDCHPCLSAKDNRFVTIKQNIFRPINKLTSLFPCSK